MKQEKAIFAIFKKRSEYIVKYDKEVVTGVLKLRNVLLNEAVALMRFHNERKEKDGNKRNQKNS